MQPSAKNVVILGATGSIGQSALEVISTSDGRLRCLGITSHSKLDRSVEFCQTHRPDYLIATDLNKANSFDFSSLPATTKLEKGTEPVADLVSRDDVDCVIAAIVGSAGIHGTIAALKAGKRVGLANKETLVMAGQQVMKIASDNSAEIIPVDSEHSAVYQSLKAGHPNEVKKILLTASGGPFRKHSKQQLDEVQIEDALAHPTWSMGPKISVDSATMMNKALEIIEARWLFDLKPDQIGVVVHPQSIVHSFVEFVDGSVIAQMSPPDMKLPIQYALDYPERTFGTATRMNWEEAMSLEFEPPDLDRFPALSLGFQVAASGGSAGAVLNAANEVAVEKFLAGHLRFNEIVPACKSVLDHHNYDANPTLDELFEYDRWARKEISSRVCT